MDGVIRGATLLEHDLVLLAGNRTDDIETSLPVYTRSCDGILHFEHDLTPKAQAAIQQSGLPFVSIGGSGSPEWPVASIDIDNAGAARALTEHLITLGHRRFGIFLKDEESVSLERLLGFRSALQAAGIGVSESNILSGGYTVSAGSDMAQRILCRAKHDWPTAIVCFNDTVALGVLAFAVDNGISVPSDISVAGFDDIMDAQLSRPPLTTVRQPLRDIGIQAVQLLVNIIEGDRPADFRMFMPHELVVRGSTAPPKCR